MPNELLPKLPDMSWIKPMADEAIGMIRELKQSVTVAYAEGFWQGSVTAAVVILLIFCVTRKQ